MLKEICRFIQADDRNSDIMACYEEYLDGEMDKNTLIEICQNALGAAKEDYIMSGQLVGNIASYYKWLGI